MRQWQRKLSDCSPTVHHIGVGDHEVSIKNHAMWLTIYHVSWDGYIKAIECKQQQHLLPVVYISEMGYDVTSKKKEVQYNGTHQLQFGLSVRMWLVICIKSEVTYSLFGIRWLNWRKAWKRWTHSLLVNVMIMMKLLPEIRLVWPTNCSWYMIR